MPKNTNEKNIITENLKYIGLNLEDIPEFLLDYKNVDFKPVKADNNNEFKVYKYIPIKDIQILITPTNRLNTAFEKYSKAEPINQYLDRKNEDNIIKYATLLKMFEKVNIKEIDKIEKEQKQFRKKIPFKVKYDDNYLWEIYYSEYTGKYFMMVTIEDKDYSCFFYLLKKQLELYSKNKDELIFVPINYIDYTAKYLKKSEISDIEKYIWLFTKQWPQIYEVFNKDNNITIHIVGKTGVYDQIQTIYKNELTTKEDASKFYQLLKALFILQTELPNHYHFDTQIGENGELIFEYNSKVINFEHLSKFIKEEYKKYASELEEIFTKKEKEEINLEKLKLEEQEKNLEYLFKEKQLATYLECRGTIFGRLKYFFKAKNGKFVRSKVKDNIKKETKKSNQIEKSISNSIVEEKEYYTIEDLIKICIEIDRIEAKIKNIELDTKALIDKIKSISNKIKNANLYLQKIEEHKKSIFEFWKFANKDEAIGLNAGEEIEEKKVQKQLKRTFNYTEDFEDIGIEVDKIQRDTLTQKQCDAIFLATTNVLEDINNINENKSLTDNILQKIKEEAKQKLILFNSEEYDIFGNVKEDKTKISMLANKKHREVEKNKIKLLDITKDLTLQDYEENIKQINKQLQDAIKKLTAITDIDIYSTGIEKLNTNHIGVFHINPINAIEEAKEDEKINLYKISIKEGMNLAYCSNIIYYDNNNNTLPVGMNINDKVIFDMSKYNLNIKKQKVFRINQDIDEINTKSKIVCVYEYVVGVAQ